jgi:dihydrolipoamide dehydrogenase
MKLAEAPGRILIWGGGAGEVEFASLYAALGSQVTLVVDGPYPLPEEDYEVGQRLQGALRDQGVQVLVSSRVVSSTSSAEGLRVVLAGAKGETVVAVDRVLRAGRVPASGDLGLAAAGVAMKEGAVVVDDGQQTSVPGIYAVGDVTGHPMYSCLATAAGLVAAENAMGGARRLDRRAAPRHAFTLPEVAAVGLTEDQATEAGYDVEVANIAFATNPRAMGLGEVEGGVKMVTDRRRGRVLGVHIVGHGATELIAEAALAIHLEALAEDLAWAIRVHPTVSESLVEAGRAILGQALNMPKF